MSDGQPKELEQKQPLGIGEYLGNKVYKAVCKRLFERHSIRFPDHVDSILSVGVNHGQGIEFIARDAADFASLLRMPHFAPDDGQKFVDSIASMATTGQGYREAGVPSLHIAVSSGVCSVHIDTFGFVAIGPNGEKSYDPDAIQHIIDELLMQDMFVGWVTGHNRWLGAKLGHVHLRVPNSRTGYRLAAGVRINVAQGVGWGIGFEVNHSLAGETQYMGKVDVFGW